MNLPWHLYFMAIIYILAGINHFRNPRLYLKIIPDYLPSPRFINYLSGAIEFILGIALCIPLLTNHAAWGVIGILIAIFPTHIFMIQNEKASMRLPKWVLYLRLPLQFCLIYWAYQYT